MTEFVEPMITVRANGAACVALPTASCSPGGLEAKESDTVFGWRFTVVEACNPFESVAVSVSSR